jgi:hypothetical protein
MLAQVTHACRTALDGVADVSLGDGVADTNVHRGFLGKWRLA